MKTGSTMNFLKRAGAILMLVAVFASSCNKYADDFKQINTKLDALAAQVAGVTTLSTSLTALTAQVTALQTAVAGLPTNASITALQTSLTANAAAIAAITTTLNTVATAGTATKAVVDGLKTDLTALATKVAADNAALKLQITALATTDIAQSAQLTALVASNVTILASITALQTSLAGLASGSDATALTIQALQVMLNAQKLQLDQLLANSNMYNGDVTITTGPELTFYAKKISQLGIINGNLIINTTALSTKLDSVNFVVKNIGAIIGSQSGVKNSVTVTSTSTSTLLDLSQLVSVAGNYTVSGVDVSDANLSNVGGNFSVTYDGPYAYPNLTTVTGNLTLTRVATSIVAPIKAGTTSINLPGVVVSGSVFDGTNAASVLVYPEATTIILSGGVTSLTAAVATQITLGATAYASGLRVSAPTAAAVVDLSAATSAAGAVSVTTGNGGTVLFTKLLSAAGGVTVNTGTSGTVNFSVLASADGGVSLTGPATIEFPLLVSGALTSDATTVTLAKYEAAKNNDSVNLTKVVTLTLGSIDASINLDLGTLVTANISGKAHTTWAATAGAVVMTSASAKLTTLTLGGNLASASLVGLTKLTSLTTSGVINSLTVDGASLLTAMTLGHTYYQPGNVANGGPGSNLVIKNNPLLTALAPSVLDYPASIVITGNAKLASVDLSSYKTKLLSASGANTTITINTNALVGDYTNAIAITPTTPYAETVIKSADLAKLKAFVALYPAPAAGVYPTITLAINIDKVTLGGVAGNATLSARMSADAAHTTANGAPFNFAAPATGITTQKEFTLVQ